MNRAEQTTPIIPIRLSGSTIYLIPCNNGYLQIDTVYKKDYEPYRQNLRKANIPLEKIRYVFLTHHHDDHAGFLNDLTLESNVILNAHQKSVDLLLSGRNDKSRGGGYVSPLVKMRLDKEWTLTFPPFEVRQADILVSSDNDKLLRELGIPGNIIETTRHCIDHISLLMDTVLAFCGDAAADMLCWASTKYCSVFMTDMEMAYQSWDRLIKAGTKRVFPAYGKPFSVKKLRQN